MWLALEMEVFLFTLFFIYGFSSLKSKWQGSFWICSLFLKFKHIHESTWGSVFHLINQIFILQRGKAAFVSIAVVRFIHGRKCLEWRPWIIGLSDFSTDWPFIVAFPFVWPWSIIVLVLLVFICLLLWFWVWILIFSSVEEFVAFVGELLRLGIKILKFIVIELVIVVDALWNQILVSACLVW